MLLQKFFKKNFKTICLILLFLVVFAVGALVSVKNGKSAFLGGPSIRSLLFQMSASGVMMVGMACLLMSGSIDLSTDAQALLGIVTFAYLVQLKNGAGAPLLPWGVVFLICGCLMVCMALLHSFLCNKLGFMPFIATIATSSVYSGISTWWTSGGTVAINRASFVNLGKTSILTIGKQQFIPVLFIIAVVIIAVYALMLVYTRFGRSIYLCGGNRRAARLAGLNPEKISTILFVNNSVLALVGGLMWAAQKKMASVQFSTSAPSMGGMTAAILGGVSFMGGGATGLGGAFVGLILLNTFTYSLNYYPIFTQQKWDWLQTTLGGVILVAALILDAMTSQRAQKQFLAARKKTVAANAKLEAGA
jgi:ribose/xylose/arabinose/galactoside ABC-type transport system permease subunit